MQTLAIKENYYNSNIQDKHIHMWIGIQVRIIVYFVIVKIIFSILKTTYKETFNVKFAFS